MIKFIKWFFSPSEKIVTDTNDVYDMLIGLEERIVALEEENIETSNTLYELSNSIEAVDVRIDILTAEKWISKDV